jgi:hypothetical protein
VAADGGDQFTTRDILLRLEGDLARFRDEMRDRFHRMQTTWATLENRVRDLETFQRLTERRLEEAEKAREIWVPVIQELRETDHLAEKVGEELRKAESRGWSKRERIGLIVFLGCSIIGALGTIVSVLIALKIGATH